MSESIVDKKIPSWGTVDKRGKDKTPIEPVRFPFPNSLDLANNPAALKKGRGGDLGSNTKPGASAGFTPTKVYSKAVKRNP
jgi:hypothetical protein